MLETIAVAGVKNTEDEDLREKFEVAVDELKTMLYNGRVARDAFFCQLFYSAQIAGEQDGFKYARRLVANTYDESMEYVKEFTEAYERTKAAVGNV